MGGFVAPLPYPREAHPQLQTSPRRVVLWAKMKKKWEMVLPLRTLRNRRVTRLRGEGERNIDFPGSRMASERDGRSLFLAETGRQVVRSI